MFVAQQRFQTQEGSINLQVTPQENEREKNERTILNQDWIGPESSFILYIKIVPIAGKVPKIKLRVLYLPVVCIIHPAKIEPVDIEILFGNRWRPRTNLFWWV